MNLYFPHIAPDDLEAKTVFPDIIVHKRGTTKNLLVIEVKKKDGGKDTKDIQKLKIFTHPEGFFKYHIGIFLMLGQNLNDVSIRVFENGKRTKEWTNDLRKTLEVFGYGQKS